MTDARRADRRHALIVAAMLVVLSAFHFATDVHAVAIHDLLFKATFVPLILAGLWFRPPVALAWSAATSGVYLWHVFGDLSSHGHDSLWLGDIVLYNVVTVLTAVLSQRRAAALAQARRHATKLEENARALLRAEESLRQGDRLRAMGELAAGMAHEIRNPLSGIRGASDVLRRGDAAPGVTAEFWALLESEIARLNDVVGNFLEFARPPKAAVVPVRIHELTAAMFLLLRPEASRRGVVCENDVPPDLLARADEALLRQILLNLTLNAVQVQPNGGRVRVVARSAENGVEIDVMDEGPGVPDRLRGSLFDAYVTDRADGTGLGLAVGARLATGMEGKLELASTGASGSTFRITLPRP